MLYVKGSKNISKFEREEKNIDKILMFEATATTITCL